MRKLYFEFGLMNNLKIGVNESHAQEMTVNSCQSKTKISNK